MTNRRLGQWAFVVIVVGIPLLAATRTVQDLVLRWQGWQVVAEPSDVRIEPPINGDTSSAIVQIRNLGDSPIRVVGASTSCNCISPVGQFPLTLGPREARPVSFNIIVDLTTYEADKSIGEVQFFVEGQARTIGATFWLMEQELLEMAETTGSGSRTDRV
jgi:hypothetical protein